MTLEPAAFSLHFLRNRKVLSLEGSFISQGLHFLLKALLSTEGSPNSYLNVMEYSVLIPSHRSAEENQNIFLNDMQPQSIYLCMVPTRHCTPMHLERLWTLFCPRNLRIMLCSYQCSGSVTFLVRIQVRIFGSIHLISGTCSFRQ